MYGSSSRGRTWPLHGSIASLYGSGESFRRRGGRFRGSSLEASMDASIVELDNVEDRVLEACLTHFVTWFKTVLHEAADALYNFVYISSIFGS